MNLEKLLGDPSSWVPFRGSLSKWMSSHEEVGRRVKVFANLIVVLDPRIGIVMAPHDYQPTSEAYPEGLVRGRWRPQLYYRTDNWHCMASQHELLWRWNTAGNLHQEASAKARQILLDHLTEHQMLEYILTDQFTIRGGSTGNTYVIQHGGFSLISAQTRVELVSYCLHPEYWLPHDDVALATKLALECADTEEAVLQRATAYPRQEFMRALHLAAGNTRQAMLYPHPRRATRLERYAADMERELV